MNLSTITNVNIIDVERGTLLPGQTVLIGDGKIIKISPHLEMTSPEDARQIEGQGLYLIPGLVDAHVHYFDMATFGHMMIANGILAVRDMGNMLGQILPFRDDLNRGEILGPEMIAVGAVLDGDPPFIPPISVNCKSPEEGRSAARQQMEAGVDQIKVYSKLEKDVYSAILDEAHKNGYKAVGHIPECIYIEEAAAAGQDSLEHLFGFEKIIGKLLGERITLETGGMMPDAMYWPRLPEVKQEFCAALDRIIASGVTICPTNVTFRNFARRDELEAGKYPRQEYITPLIRGIWATMWPPSAEMTETIRQIWPFMLQCTRLLHDAGARLVVGTDLLLPGVIPGYSVHEEMALWQETGIPAADVLRSATILPARFMGMSERVGTIQEAKVASMVLLRANPLEDIRNTQKIEGVFLRGRFFSRADLDHLLEEVRTLAQE